MNARLLHSAYGGSPFISVQYTFPSRNPSGQDTQRMFIFPKHELDPSMPYLPGQPGIVIDNRYLRTKVPQPWSLFRKVSGAKGLSTTWLYLGEYEFVYKGKMSTEVFSAQNDAVKQNWAEGHLGQKHSLNDAHFSMLARITLRKAGSLPCSDQSQEDALVEKEKDKILAGKGSYPVSKDDIVDAFAWGDERRDREADSLFARLKAIDITALKCVAYDHVLAGDIEAKCASFNGYTVPEFMVKRNPKQGASKNALVTNKVGTSIDVPSARVSSTNVGLVPPSVSARPSSGGSGKAMTKTTMSLADMFTNPLPPSSREGDHAMGFGSGARPDSLDGEGFERDVDYYQMGESSRDGDGEAGEELGWDDGDGEIDLRSNDTHPFKQHPLFGPGSFLRPLVRGKFDTTHSLVSPRPFTMDVLRFLPHMHQPGQVHKECERKDIALRSLEGGCERRDNEMRLLAEGYERRDNARCLLVEGCERRDSEIRAGRRTLRIRYPFACGGLRTKGVGKLTRRSDMVSALVPAGL
ncbi:hypothetical protein NMY22_g1791 [Coprinellus aureogranulatus]|nr:hypothetical protein NMY22_g1791 [Coprinellus aureogranulatus]